MDVKKERNREGSSRLAGGRADGGVMLKAAETAGGNGESDYS